MAGANGNVRQILQKIEKHESLAGVDLRNLYLSGMDLSNLDLKGANLKGCRLSNGKLAASDLTNADLSDAMLINASFKKANLAGTIFHGTRVRLGRSTAPWPRCSKVSRSVFSLTGLS